MTATLAAATGVIDFFAPCIVFAPSERIRVFLEVKAPLRPLVVHKEAVNFDCATGIDVGVRHHVAKLRVDQCQSTQNENCSELHPPSNIHSL